MPSIDVTGRSFHYERRGSGEPLLLIMGLSGNSAHWGEPFLSLLERDFDVIAFDNRGMGRSGWVDADFTIAEMAGDAAGVLAGLGLDAAHVMGISMGGMIAQELALTEPERVRGLVLGCTYAGGEGSALADQSVVETLTGPMLSGDRDAAIRAGWSVNVSEPFAADEAAFARFKQTALEHPAPLAVVMRQFQAVGGHDTSRRLAQIGAPTLVVHGTEDRMLPVANARLIAAAVPGARLELLDGVGHMFWWERPERSAQLVHDFLFDVDERAVAAAPDVA